MSFDCPPEPKSYRCELCNERAEVGALCVRHAIRARVDDNELDQAYAIASDFGWPSSSVRRAIRDRDEYAMRLEAKRPCCKRCQAELTEHNRGQWPATGCCLDCEHKALTEAIAANDTGRVAS